MEMAAGGSLTSYVADKWQKAQALGLFLSEDEARYFFKVRAGPPFSFRFFFFILFMAWGARHTAWCIIEGGSGS
jgi:hypothetical protein